MVASVLIAGAEAEDNVPGSGSRQRPRSWFGMALAGPPQMGFGHSCWKRGWRSCAGMLTWGRAWRRLWSSAGGLISGLPGGQRSTACAIYDFARFAMHCSGTSVHDSDLHGLRYDT
mmetsp:Transcript_49127/g.158127  ORF Transcript_49127/g.158127 Transcript_49127/m.158127 type:complete len:116 (+) Transcript_49127:1029-1376(+)